MTAPVAAGLRYRVWFADYSARLVDATCTEDAWAKARREEQAANGGDPFVLLVERVREPEGR